MAIQIQLRRGTAAAWTSANPTLAAGELVIETDTDKYKIGDGSTAWTSLGYSSLPSTAITTGGGTFTGAITINGASPIVLEGATSNDYETTIAVTDPTADRTITIPNETGTVVTTAGGTFTGAVTIPDLTVTGTTTTVSSTNTVVADSLFELNNGASSNTNDLGIVMERGSTGDNAIIAWDESADKFTMGTTTATGASTGDLSITAGTLVADLEGDVTGDVTGNVSGTNATFTGTTTTYVDVVQETGTSHTFALSDAGKYIHCTTPSANCTITLPSDATMAFPIGTQMLFSSPHASNKVVFAAGSNAAVTSLDDNLSLKGPDGVAAVIKWTTNSWLLFGPLE